MTKREVNIYQIHLLYSNYPSNHFDSIVKKMTKQIEVEKAELSKKQDEDVKKRFLTEMQIYLLKKELFSFSQMRIIYKYMQFEIHLKKLISIAYKIPEKEFYNWDKVVSFFKSKDINIKELKNYSDVKNIQELNNSIKHSKELLNTRTTNIPEFQNKKSVNVSLINNFYERTMNSPKELILEIIQQIEKDLYEFNENRIGLIAKEFNNRMDEVTKEKFIKKLKNK